MKEKAIFIQSSSATFVKKDIALLKQHFDVKVYKYPNRGGLIYIYDQVLIIAWLIKNIRNTKFIYFWFLDHYILSTLLIAKIFQKPAIGIIAGYESTSIPKLNYGAHRKKWRSILIKISAFLCTSIIAVSNYSADKFLFHTSKKLSNKIHICYNSIDTNLFKENKAKKRKVNSFLTICGGSSINRAKIKGIDDFISLAKENSENSYTIVGLSGKALAYAKKSLPTNSNLIFLPVSTVPELITIYSEHEYICQFSKFESFGVAVLEGISCGCIPITYNDIGTSEIINKQGYILDRDKPLSAQIKLQINNKTKFQLRQFVIDTFSDSKRDSIIIKRIKANF